MKARTSTTILSFLFGAGLACATTLALAGGAMVPEFAELDSDGDGTLDRSECMDSPAASTMGPEVAEAHYRMYDVDGSGGVSDEEYAQVNRQAFERLERKAI